MRRWLTGLLLTTLFACPQTEVVDGEVPPEVRWIAVVELDPAGAVRRASKLEPFASSGALPLFSSPDSDVVVAGFDDDAIAPLLEAGISPTDRTIEVAAPCAPELTPRWAARIDDDDRLTTFTSLPPLTIAGLEDVCPDLPAEDITVDVDCREQICLKSVSRSGCLYEFDLSGCALGTIGARLQPDGSMCVLPQTLDGCEADPSPTDALGGLDCELPLDELVLDCNVDLLTVPPAPPWSEVLRTTVVEIPTRSWRGNWVSNDLIEHTELFDVVATSEAVFVTHLTDPNGRAHCAKADDDPTTLARFDLETGAKIDAAPTLTCLHQLRRDADGFAGVYFDDTNHFGVARFDANGVLTSSSTLGGRLPTTSYDIGRLDYAAELDRLVLLARSETDGVALVIVPDDLTIEREVTFPYETCRELSVDGTTAVITCAPAFMPADIIRFDIRDGRTIEEGTFVPGRIIRSAFSFTDLYAPGGDPVIAVTRDLRSIRTWGGGDQFGSAGHYESYAEPGRLGPWRPDSSLVLVTGMKLANEDGPPYNTINLYDRTHRRLRPGTWSVGESVIAGLSWDDNDRLWLLLPMTGELVRITTGE